MVDYGLITLFAVQVGLVFGCYHAWSSMKRELKDVLAMKADLISSTEAGNAAKTAMQALAADVEKRVQAAENIPGGLVKRMAGIEDQLKLNSDTIVTHGDRITSLGARLSASLRRGKHREEDTDPAAQAEGTGQQNAEYPPGPIFAQQPAPAPGISPGFGVLKRRVG